MMKSKNDFRWLLYWITEREAIRLRRQAGRQRPWTDDPILGQWSFCNVMREHDRVTRWIADNWRTPHSDDPELWFAMAVARLTNWPETMDAIGYPAPWGRARFILTLRRRAARGDKVWGDAYVISGGGKTGKGVPKDEYIASVLDELWQQREQLRPRMGERCAEFHGRLMRMNGFGSFLAAQVVADMKYVAPLKDARDWLTFAASGPGSRRGLNRVLGRPVDASWNEDAWRAALRDLHDMIRPELERIGLGDLHAQDLQNCLCELSKYERTRLGEGTPKRRYVERVP
jgi:5-hmdU DNA kinase-like protein